MVFPIKSTLKQIQVTYHLNPSLKNKKKEINNTKSFCKK